MFSFDCCIAVVFSFQPDGGIVRATLAVQALLEAAERTGFADVLEHQDVSSVVPHGPGQGVSVFTKSGDVVVGGAAVVAAGGWVRRVIDTGSVGVFVVAFFESCAELNL